jgi:hypothetical protein
MAVSWTVSCSCGWVAVAKTINEAAALVEAHAEQRKGITPHAITIMDKQKRGPRRRPFSGGAPI